MDDGGDFIYYYSLGEGVLYLVMVVKEGISLRKDTMGFFLDRFMGWLGRLASWSVCNMYARRFWGDVLGWI